MKYWNEFINELKMNEFSCQEIQTIELQEELTKEEARYYKQFVKSRIVRGELNLLIRKNKNRR